MSITVKGNHPYADEFPMASAEELDELAASIATVGLIHPVVLTPQGLVLDGRNRLAACEKAGVEPTFETRDAPRPPRTSSCGRKRKTAPVTAITRPVARRCRAPR